MTFLGIDATNWVHVLWHARSGVDVVPAVCGRVEALCRKLQPTVCVACFDRRSFRHDLVPDYKSNRKPRPPGLTADLAAAEPALKETLAAFRMDDQSLLQWTVAAVDGFEADDGLATLAQVGKLARAQVILASPDKDLRQCLAPGVSLLRSFKLENGLPTKGEWYTEMSLFDDFGLTASQWPDFQILVGDKTDAIQGVAGFGPKTAAEALQKCKTLDAMLANPWAVPCSDARRNALFAFKPRVAVARQLVTLRTNVECVLDAVR